jgi:hypothetical protein
MFKFLKKLLNKLKPHNCLEHAYFFYGCYFCEKCNKNLDKLLGYRYADGKVLYSNEFEGE